MATEPKGYPVTPDGRYFVVKGRLWRCTNPALSSDAKARLTKQLMAARRLVAFIKREGRGDAELLAARAKVDKAKIALGERGPVWWTDGAPDQKIFPQVKMGEARRRKEALKAEPCYCGSNKPARDCCYAGQWWHKTPATLGLSSMVPGIRAEKCYMKELGSCGGGISGEHLISKSVIEILRADGDFTVGGVPWLPLGEIKALSPNSLTANCLCRDHNAALSPLDAAAARLFAWLKNALEQDGEPTNHAILSGHDIERWLLKTAKAMAVSRNFARGREPLSGAFAHGIDVLELLNDPRAWHPNTGLYCVMQTGDIAKNHARFQIAPMTNPLGDVSGLTLNILGVQFILVIEPLDMQANADLQRCMYRPGGIVVSRPGSTTRIGFSWEDKQPHRDLTLSFLQKVPARP